MAGSNLDAIAAWYKWFATNEADGQSPLYANLSRHIADDKEALSFLAALPRPKRQPNLLFASYRSLFGTPTDWPDFRSRLLSGRDAVAVRMLERSTQTNEPARCAVLLPLLAQLPQPLAIVEVGAAAGLCLLLDRYGYDYGSRQLMPDAQTDAPVFPCQASANTPLPDRLPEIAWRAGLDLNPLDVSDSEQMAWLDTLVWPGQEQRLARLKKAISVARADPPRVLKGDLASDLEALLSEAPDGVTKVVFHSAVLNYVPSQDIREDFAEKAMKLADYWIANESPLVLPRYAPEEKAPSAGSFMLSLNGRPVAWTNPHGASIVWRDES